MTSLSRRAPAPAATAALVGASTMPAAAQVVDPRPPTVDTSAPEEIAPGVRAVRDHRVRLVPNIGIVPGTDAALAVGTGLGPASGERALGLARRIAGPRRLPLTVTRFHPEHGYGAQAFRPDATILCNRAQRDELEQKGARYVGPFRQTRGKAAADALDGTEIVMPHAVHGGPGAQIDRGGRKVELRTWGTAHTRGDQVVHLPRERIPFAGDLIEERMFPTFPWFPGARWVDVLNGFECFNPAVVVPGHGDLGGIGIARNLASPASAAFL